MRSIRSTVLLMKSRSSSIFTSSQSYSRGDSKALSRRIGLAVRPGRHAAQRAALSGNGRVTRNISDKAIP